MEERGELTGASLPCCCLVGAGSHVRMQQMSTCRQYCNVDIDVEWYWAQMLFCLMKSQQGNLETFLVDRCCRGGPMPLPKVQSGGKWPFGKLCSAQLERWRVTKLSLTIQVMFYIKLMQNPLVSIILTLYILCRSFFRSWFLGLISINDTDLLLHVKLATTNHLKIWIPNPQHWMSFDFWRIKIWRGSIRLLFYHTLFLHFSPWILDLEYSRRISVWGKSWH